MAFFYTVSAFSQKEFSRINAAFRFDGVASVAVEAERKKKKDEKEKYCKELVFDFSPVELGGSVCAALAYQDRGLSSFTATGKEKEDQDSVWLLRFFQTGSATQYVPLLEEAAERISGDKALGSRDARFFGRLRGSFLRGDFRFHLERLDEGNEGADFLFPLRWIEVGELYRGLCGAVKDGLWYLSNLRVRLKDGVAACSVGSGEFAELSDMVKTNLRHGLRDYLVSGRAQGWSGDGFNYFTPALAGEMHISVRGRGVRLGKLEASRLLFLLSCGDE